MADQFKKSRKPEKEGKAVKNFKSRFSEEQLQTLSEIGIELLDEVDYSDDNLFEMHDKITDYYTFYGFDRTGEPLPLAYRCESLIDFFYDELDI